MIRANCAWLHLSSLRFLQLPLQSCKLLFLGSVLGAQPLVLALLGIDELLTPDHLVLKILHLLAELPLQRILQVKNAHKGIA
jgi:hypothetical protein